MKKRFQSDDNHNRRLSAVVKIKYFPLFTDGTGSASQDSWAKSVVVVWKCESHIGPWTFFPLTFLLFEQADFLFWTFVSWVRKKKKKKNLKPQSCRENTLGNNKTFVHLLTEAALHCNMIMKNAWVQQRSHCVQQIPLYPYSVISKTWSLSWIKDQQWLEKTLQT